MWEAVAAPGRRDDLARWALSTWPDAEVYVGEDDRVVAIGAGAGEAPRDLLARAPQAWEFERVARS
jgi:hypothetical protein